MVKYVSKHHSPDDPGGLIYEVLQAGDDYMLRDGKLGAESGRQSRNVGYSTDFVRSAPESRRGTSSRLSSARDPTRKFVRPHYVVTSAPRLCPSRRPCGRPKAPVDVVLDSSICPLIYAEWVIGGAALAC